MVLSIANHANEHKTSDLDVFVNWVGYNHRLLKSQPSIILEGKLGDFHQRDTDTLHFIFTVSHQFKGDYYAYREACSNDDLDMQSSPILQFEYIGNRLQGLAQKVNKKFGINGILDCSTLTYTKKR